MNKWFVYWFVLTDFVEDRSFGFKEFPSEEEARRYARYLMDQYRSIEWHIIEGIEVQWGRTR